MIKSYSTSSISASKLSSVVEGMDINVNWPSWLKSRTERSLLRDEDVMQKPREQNSAADTSQSNSLVISNWHQTCC